MIGRERECDVLRRAVASATEGGVAYLLVVGDPGIGKSTLLRLLSELASNAGLIVGCGRGVPEGVAPLWPWTSALDTISRHAPDDSPTLALTSPHQATKAPRAIARAGDRFMMFERFAEQLERRATCQPLALVIDDLHWADISALRLFQHLVERPRLPGVVLAGSLRTTEPLAPYASEVVSRLLAHPSAEVIEVPPLQPDEIAAFATARLTRPPRDDEIQVLIKRSGGNPFFLGELLGWVRVLGPAVDLDDSLPLAVRESVRRRLVVEDPTTQRVVQAAAIAGSAASVDLLVRTVEAERRDVGRALDAATRAGLLVVQADGTGEVSFVHDLVRQAVESLIPTWSRVELHHAIGMTLRARPTSSWTAVTKHLIAARPLVDDTTFIEVVTRAAEEAVRSGAYDLAASHLRLALDAMPPAEESAERGRTLLEYGRALWAAVRAGESKVALSEAANLARRSGDAELLAKVALSWRGGEFRIILRRGDDQFLALLREALEVYPLGDSALRCLLLARLALCAYWDIGDPHGVAECDEAVEMARRLRDPETLTAALGTRFYYRWRPDWTRERLGIADEIMATACTSGDAALLARGSYFRIVSLLELGRLRDAWTELERFSEAADSSGQPLLALRALWFRSAQSLVTGQRGQADAMAAQACRLAERMGRRDAAVERLGQAVFIWPAEDRVAEAIELLDPAVVGSATYDSALAIVNGLGGLQAPAQAAIRSVVSAGLDRHPRDMTWMFARCGLLTAAVVSGDQEVCELLYTELLPFAGQWAVLNPGIVVAGAVDHYLGLGAARLGRLDCSVDHLRRAARAHEREGAVALALWSLHELAIVLAHRHGAGDAAEIASVEARIGRLATENTVPFKPLLTIGLTTSEVASIPRDERLVLEGDTWLVEYAGSRTRLRDQRGLHYLRALLEHPGVEIPALVLAGAGQTFSGSVEGTILDEQAIRQYRRRMSDLQEDIDEAAANNDLGRRAQAEAEMQALVDELASASGLGGRQRQFSGAEERARVSVTKAIRTTIHHLGDSMPDLAQHLSFTIHTGNRCIYQPDPRAPIHWSTERL